MSSNSNKEAVQSRSCVLQVLLWASRQTSSRQVSVLPFKKLPDLLKLPGNEMKDDNPTNMHLYVLASVRKFEQKNINR